MAETANGKAPFHPFDIAGMAIAGSVVKTAPRGVLISQFILPYINRRRSAWGGGFGELNFFNA